MLTVAGEVLDGFHLETIPQLSSSNSFDINALSATAGIRAVWLLYIAGEWEHLEDLGVNREEVEPVLKRLRYGARLTEWQAGQLQKKVPSLKEASTELRIAYALKTGTKKRRTKMEDETTQQTNRLYIYHAEVGTSAHADDIVKRHKPEIEAAGGTIEAGHGRGNSIVMVKLPASLNVDPANILAGSGLKFSKVRAQVVPVPQDQGPDPRPLRSRTSGSETRSERGR